MGVQVMSMDSIVDRALQAKYVVLSVSGPHAGEELDGIVTRKLQDIRDSGRTFWRINSYVAQPDKVQQLARKAPHVYALFITPARPSRTKPAGNEDTASQYSPDNRRWQPIPAGIGPVTGKLAGACGLIMDRLERVQQAQQIDLWEYADADDSEEPVEFGQGRAAVCAVKRESGASLNGLESRFRRLIAVGRLVAPFGVWLR